MGNGWLSRLRRCRRGLRGQGLLCRGEMGIVGIQPTGEAEECLDMGQARRGVGLCEGCDLEPIGPSLRHNRVRLGLIEQVVAPLIQLSSLLG